MDPITQPLRDEHHDLLPHVESLRLAGDAITEPYYTPRAMRDLESASDFLMLQAMPHSHAEDEVLYPVIQRIMGAELATADMSREHVEIYKLANELAAVRQTITGTPITEAQATSLRRILYSLYAIIKLHLIKEEEIYFPLLDQSLSEEEATELFETMEYSAQAARDHQLQQA